jgi:hypothetical protein
MEVAKVDLEETYSSMETDNLVELYVSGELTEVAFTVLTQVLKKRGVSPYDLYVKLSSQKLRQQKNILEVEVSNLLSEIDKLNLEIRKGKIRKKKKIGMISLYFQRKRLEEEQKISDLKSRLNKYQI